MDADSPCGDTEFAHPTAACDIIMKGGITSGVIYPLAITELAKRYRLANIGGTSAGAIAAAAAAAAEYGRNVPGKGFVRLTRLPDEAGKILFSLFQPAQTVAPLFNIFVAALKAKTSIERLLRIGAAAVWGFRWQALLGTLVALIIAYAMSRFAGIGGVAFGVLLAGIGLILGILTGIVRVLTKHLPANNYGMCSGLRQPGYQGPGFTDWLADLIDETAGRDPTRDPPLTFGDLAHPSDGRPPINLRMMTTNLMQLRPHTLPFEDQVYAFERQDFARIFPPRIVNYLLAHSEPAKLEAGDTGEFYKFPRPEDLPVVVAARMSLSFPVLISAVPLYAPDHTLKGDEGKKLQRCLFSDGGLSSNFPIHFFDRMLPNSPTFGISLDKYDRRRDRSTDAARETRVWMPDTASGGALLPIQPFDGLVGFLARLVDAAKDWQDNLQGTLAGYRDRIVHVYLKPEEGGLNIVMPPELVTALGQYGAQAGAMAKGTFDLDEHRWRRFLVAMDRLDQTMADFLQAYDGVPQGPEPYTAFLSRFPQHARSYSQPAENLALLLQRAADLSTLAKAWSAQPDIPDSDFPHPKTDLRITPKP